MVFPQREVLAHARDPLDRPDPQARPEATVNPEALGSQEAQDKSPMDHQRLDLQVLLVLQDPPETMAALETPVEPETLALQDPWETADLQVSPEDPDNREAMGNREGMAARALATIAPLHVPPLDTRQREGENNTIFQDKGVNLDDFVVFFIKYFK